MRTTLATTLAMTLAAAAAVAGCATTTSGTGGLDDTHLSTMASTPSPSAFPSQHSAASSSAAPSNAAPSNAASSSAAPSTRPAPGPSSTRIPPELARVLLSAHEVGPGFRRDASQPLAPLPCTPEAPPADQQLTAVEQGAIDYVNPALAAAVSERIFVYGSEATAVRHQQILEAGLACSRGTAAGVTFDIVGPQDVRGRLTPHTDRAEAWAVSNRAVQASLIEVRIHAVMIQFAFVARAGHAPHIDARQVVETALAKIINGG